MKDFSQAWCSRVEFKPHLRGFNSWMLFELGYADSTRSQYHMQIESFIESQAQYYQAYLYAGSPATVRQRICILKKFFDYLLIEGVITDNPLVEHELPKLASKLPTILTEDEVERLYTCLKDTPDELDLFVFFYYTGCRVSEIVGAMWSQVHWKSANFRFTGKGDKDRVFPILPELMEMLAKRYAAYGQKEGVIFPDVTTRFVAYRLVARWGELVGKTITPHSLRHTLATHLMNNGADLLVIRDLLGHKSVETTQRYTHVAKESLAKAYRDVF